MPSGTLFSPVSLRTDSANLRAPPECSKKAPMITPIIMTKPIPPKVFPKPSFIDFVINSNGIPENNPNKIAAIIRDKNGCHFHLVELTMINTTERNNNAKSII